MLNGGENFRSDDKDRRTNAGFGGDKSYQLVPSAAPTLDGFHSHPKGPNDGLRRHLKT